MILYHATPIRNLPSIRTFGLLPSCARNQLHQVVWLHSRSKSDWATWHVADRHGVMPKDVVILRVRVNRSALTRFRRGVWMSDATLEVE